MSDNHPYFQGIYLGGFQVFDAVTYIPLGRLNLLFGPNSAGKSAVEDALSLVMQEFFAGNFDGWLRYSRGDLRFQTLKRHWRRVGEGLETFAPYLTIGVRFQPDAGLVWDMEYRFEACGDKRAYRDGDVGHATTDSQYVGANGWRRGNAADREKLLSDWARNVISQCMGDLQVVSGPKDRDTVDVLFRCRIVNPDELYDENDGDLALASDVVCIVNGQWLFEFSAYGGENGAYCQLNFTHPVFIGYPTKIDFEKLADRYPKTFSVSHGVVRFCNDDADGIMFGYFADSNSFFGDEWDLGKDVPVDVLAAVNELRLFIRAFQNNAGWKARMEMRPLVPASRTIPSGADLCFLSPDGDEEPVVNRFWLENNGDPRYSQLCWNADVRAHVNRLLTEHMFTERGYYIGSEKLHLVPQNTKAPVASLERLFLVDAQGRQLAFDEVGSGLGYVLPVLCRVCAPVDSDAQSFTLIQQPELHLHPALQAALGDVFIECSSSRNQMIVETHSEHLLLRILKRIRQSCSDRPPVPELNIRPEDVCILYFDPSPTGATQVRRIRVGEDGDFLDRWPRGFFGERDQELFDE